MNEVKEKNKIRLPKTIDGKRCVLNGSEAKEKKRILNWSRETMQEAFDGSKKVE